MKKLILLTAITLFSCTTDSTESAPEPTNQLTFREEYIGEWRTTANDFIISIQEHSFTIETATGLETFTEATQMAQNDVENNLGLSGNRFLNFRRVGYNSMYVTYTDDDNGGELILYEGYYKL